MSVNSKMTAIADAIRAKTGGTGLLTLDDMAQDIAAIDTSENLDDVLTEQDSIIDQIQAALEGKAAGGGAAAVETCTVEITSDSVAQILVLAYSYLATDGKVSTLYTDYETGVSNANISLENVVCGSLIYVSASSSWLSCRSSDNVRMFDYSRYTHFEAPTTANSIGTIYFYDDD